MNPNGVRLHNWFPTMELLLAAVAGALWYTQGSWVGYAGVLPGPWPLILLVIMWGLRWAARRRSPPAGPDRKVMAAPPSFAAPFFLFLAAAAMSLWAAYNPQIAGVKGWLLIGALGIYWALAHQPDLPRVTVALALLQLAGAGIAGFFLLTQDWQATPYAGTAIARLAQAIGTRLPQALADETLNPNVAGGILLVALPLSIPLLAAAWRNRTRARLFLAAYTGSVFALTVTGWFFTGSRGAHVTLLATGCLWLCGRLLCKLSPRRRPVALVALIVVAGVILGAGATVVTRTPTSTTQATAPAALQNRLWLWQLGASLVRDTPFTGIGLGMFEMPLSLYALLIHVGYVEHGHNLLLNIAIEQGVLGAAAFAVMALTALYRGLTARISMTAEHQLSETKRLTADLGHPPSPLVLESALASLSTILIHGFIDDPLYSSRGILWLFVPFGLLTALERIYRSRIAGTVANAAQSWLLLTGRTVGLTMALTIAIIGSIVGISGSNKPGNEAPWTSRWQAAWHANLGAVMQMKVELTAYDQLSFATLSMDDVRRQEDLGPARRQFIRAAELDPGNATARQRQAMLALAAFDYDEALALMQAVWEAGHRDRVTRLLYGDALVALGQVDEAVAVVQGLPFAQPRLEGQAWDRYQKRNDLERADYARKAAQSVQ